MRNILSIRDFTRSDIDEILTLSRSVKDDQQGHSGILEGSSLAVAFFESSLRTRAGFSLSMQKLGGVVVDITELRHHSLSSSPESFEDTFQVLGDYFDAIALRHPDPGLVKSIRVPSALINCGNGRDEHPTQTLIDLFTMSEHFDRIDGLHIAVVGDLLNMRAAHSLVASLTLFKDIELTLISPPTLRMAPAYYSSFPHANLNELTKLELDGIDVVYMAGYPHKGGTKTIDYMINRARALELKAEAIVMDPLPRVDEIAREVDNMEPAKYFEQSKNGLPVRMAVLEWLLR